MVTVSIPFPTGETANVAGSLPNRGDLALIVMGHGVIMFRDIGHQNIPCGRPYWGVEITYNDQKWGFFYDGGGRIDVTINADGSVAFAVAAGQASSAQIVQGDGPPICRSY
jgi:hypothetical protein